MSGAASNIVATLKSKIKETADELEKYEGVCEETRVRCQHTAAALLTLVTVFILQDIKYVPSKQIVNFGAHTLMSKLSSCTPHT